MEADIILKTVDNRARFIAVLTVYPYLRSDLGTLLTVLVR